jgi:hypothetical protein
MRVIGEANGPNEKEPRAFARRAPSQVGVMSQKLWRTLVKDR